MTFTFDKHRNRPLAKAVLYRGSNKYTIVVEHDNTYKIERTGPFGNPTEVTSKDNFTLTMMVDWYIEHMISKNGASLQDYLNATYPDER